MATRATTKLPMLLRTDAVVLGAALALVPSALASCSGAHPDASSGSTSATSSSSGRSTGSGGAGGSTSAQSSSSASTASSSSGSSGAGGSCLGDTLTCSAGGSPCCHGACHQGYCCPEVGEACATACCGNGVTCNESTHQCEAVTCTAGDNGDCTAQMDVPCCNAGLVCTIVNPKPQLALCCGPAKTILPAASAPACCPTTYAAPNSDGTVTCTAM